MIRIAIVEDDTRERELIKTYLEQYETERDEALQVSIFEDGEDIADEYQGKFDIILMDIEMKFMDGMTAAEKIRERDLEVVIIFLTNAPQYVMRGYKVDALDYVLKPVSYFAFSERIDKAIRKMQRQKGKFLTVSAQDGVWKPELSQILYIEVRDHFLTIHAKDRDFIVKDTMNHIEQELETQGFCRCNQSFLINLEHVDRVFNNEVSVGQDVIRMSRTRKTTFMDALNRYMNEVGL